VFLPLGDAGAPVGGARLFSMARCLECASFCEGRFAADSPLEGGGFEPPVPRPRRHPSATANHLASYHLPRKLGLRFAPMASTPSRKSSEPRRPVFKIELKPRRSAMTLSLLANRCTGHVILGLDRLTRLQPRWIASPN